MPTISIFYGIIIRMFFNEHAPPHFHVQYGEYKAEIAIETLEVRAGKLPRRALVLVLEWGHNIGPSCMRIGVCAANTSNRKKFNLWSNTR